MSCALTDRESTAIPKDIENMTSVITSKPVIVLIPGAWHTAKCYYLLVPILESAGYKAKAVDLVSVGAEPPTKSLDPDVQHIRNIIFPMIEQGKDVVVVMHSFGAVPGSSALKGLSKTDRSAQGLTGGVVSLVYLCAWVIPEGQAVHDSGGGRGGKGGSRRLKFDGEYIHFLDPIPAFYHDCPQDVQTQAVKQLRHHSRATIFAPLTYAAYQHIPSTYLFCTNDEMMTIEKQRELVENSGIKFKMFECNASHSPFLSQPGLTARVIRHAAGESIVV
jgi:pimeloyl-ACP methyl ester carboxylesterase